MDDTDGASEALQRGSEPPPVRSNVSRALPASLREFEAERSARELQRIADSEIMLELQLHGFDPQCDGWRVLQRALIGYGYSVSMAWLMTRKMKSRAAAARGGAGVIGLSQVPDGLILSDDEAHTLTVELMLVSVERFRRLSLADPSRTWRADGGASLKTYFIGRVLMDFPRVYVSWRRSTVIDGAELVDAPAHADAEHRVLMRMRVDELLAGDPVMREIFELDTHGYSRAEIAEILNSADPSARFTETSVNNRISRFRARMHEQQRARPA